VQFYTKYFKGVSIRNIAASKDKHVVDKDKPDKRLNEKCSGKVSGTCQVN
jgi:hypothetical protein